MKIKTKEIIGLILVIILAAFINVVSAGGITVTLGWTAPLTNVDDSPVEDLAGFRLYQRSDTNFVSGQDIITSHFDNVIAAPQYQGTNEFGEAMGEEYTNNVEVLTSSWFAVTAVDFSGNESDFSKPLWVDVLSPSTPQNLHYTIGW